MKQKSKWLFILLLIFILFIGIRMTIYVNLSNKIEFDAKVINELGVIRGSIQRFSKLELNHNIEDDLANNIDHLLDYYTKNGNVLIGDIYLETTRLPELKNSWDDLKALLNDYHSTPSEENKLKVIEESEKCWELSNNIVSKSQYASEKKISRIRFLTISFALDLFIILALSFISKNYVRDNLEIAVLYDPLTMAYNRKYFTEAISHEIERAKRSNKPFSLIMLDIDFFKKVNDTYGHSVGDNVLKELVSLLQDKTRKYDLVSRIGGEEFTIILPNTTIDLAYTLGERLRITVEEHDFIEDDKITISLGVTQYKDEDTLDLILKRVDDALYMAKNNGRNRCEQA
ncbi:MAG: GGDEF domain-containing protein [Tissierellales bacterium]